ncbi:1710_t:CDS:2 [Ambispora gerdemannii]|uniref:1710_t:CDS:1 n=1 Tax=Ambispora gerdemannii TaxID=144530 RepID=A0A9N9FLJ3_9GLOM|nr:1710_t:CDS:2 [Ambispora gerdemannii]
MSQHKSKLGKAINKTLRREEKEISGGKKPETDQPETEMSGSIIGSKNVEHLYRDSSPQSQSEDTSLIYYFTEDGEAKARAENAFTVFNNDEQKHAYQNLVLASCMCLVISRNMFVRLY